jgi:hypothetical protein
MLPATLEPTPEPAEVECGVGLPEAIAEILGCDPEDLRPKRQG